MIVAPSGESYDVATTAFDELPVFLKLEHLLAASVACEQIRTEISRLGRGDAHSHMRRKGGLGVIAALLVSPEFVERSAEKQHVHWLRRNQSKAWADQGLALPFRELSEEAKERSCRAVARASAACFLEYVGGHFRASAA